MNKIEQSLKKMNKMTMSIGMPSPRNFFKRVQTNFKSDSSSPSTSSDEFKIKNDVLFQEHDNEESIDLPSPDVLSLISEDVDKIVEDDSNKPIGLSFLPYQIQQKCIETPFPFTILVVGQSGLGKSTLINSMFLTDIYNDEYPGATQRAFAKGKTMSIERTSVLLKENSVNVLLGIVDTPGFGDSLDNTNCWTPIIDYIDSCHRDYINYEFNIDRNLSGIEDKRVHCCLYFIQPTGHRLKTIDIEFMKRLQNKVNLIPVIAKADCLTKEELYPFKANIIEDMIANKIKMFEFPEKNTINGNCQDLDGLCDLRDRVPFAVVSSNCIYEENGRKFRGRKYEWGTVNTENLEHCDFKALQELLIRHYMFEMVSITNNVIYENYRNQHLKQFLKR